MSRFTEEVTDALEVAERYGNLSKKEYEILDSDNCNVDVEYINGDDKVANFYDYSTNKRFSLFVSGYRSGELYT